MSSNIISQIFSGLFGALRTAAAYFVYFLQWSFSDASTAGNVYVAIIRWIMPFLAGGILLSVLWRMIRVRNPNEIWGYLFSSELGRFPIHHWECTIGRARHCDIIVKFATISRTQCALMRNDKGKWFIQDLSGRDTTVLNDSVVTEKTSLSPGSVLTIGGIPFTFHPVTQQEMQEQEERRARLSSPHPPWKSFFALTVMQLFTILEFASTKPDSFMTIASCFLLFMAGMWGYILTTKALGQTGFEPEILAFFACTLDLAVTATSTPSTMMKQTIAILIGIVVFIFVGWYLRDLNRVVHTRRLMAGICVLLFLVTIIFGGVHFGAKNWINIFGMSLQPSELAKICFIFAGSATLDRLFAKRNVLGFMLLSGFCLAALAITGDFGTASIFFVVFLVIAYMRSGDYTTLLMICGAVAGALLMVIRFRPYVASRFSAWRHVWEYADSTGYQQVRTMCASASGGFIGVGAGNGWLQRIAASNTDLVFGVLCEEWGLFIALLAVASIVALALFTFRVAQNGRSSFYSIAACAASSLFVFQVILNVFGSLDILPLTGVTFPFVSCGGSSMIASWALLAYIKAADTRQNASFAVNHNVWVQKTPEAAGYKIVNDSSSSGEPPAGKRTKKAFRNKKKSDSGTITSARKNARSTSSETRVFSISGEKKKTRETTFTEDLSPDSLLTEEDRRIQRKNAQEIDDFLSQFDRPDSDPTDDIDRFLREFELDNRHTKGGLDI